MAVIEELVTDHLDLWTSALKRKSTAGRGSSSKVELYGIKKLRELILELAVRGLLVPQDPNDEPASELLKKIAAEKARLVKEGKIKKEQPLPPITEKEKPFALPAGWEWSKLIEISANIHYGYTASSDENIRNVRLLRITDIQDDIVEWDGVPGCEIEDDKIAQYQLVDDDILIARTGGTIGKSYLVQDITVCAVFASYLLRVRHIKGMSAQYKKIYLGSLFYWRQLYAKSMGTGQPNVNGESLKALIVPVPPLAEQHRIVAKVDELMALCDQLESETDTHLSTHQTLVETLLAALTQAADNAQFSIAWERLAEHFDSLFTTEENIDQLKQTILQLAVRGLLVPQDPNDEPASELLKKIAAEKARLVKEGKIKASLSAPIREDENPFQLPSGWASARVSETITVLNGRAYKKHEMLTSGTPILRVGNLFTSNEWYYSDLELEPDKYINDGDLIYAWSASFGPFIWQGGRVIFHYHIWKMNFISPNLSDKLFFKYYLQTISASIKESGNGIAMIHMTKERMEKLVFPIPPLAEQHRIVAKVDELMAICDQIKSRLSETQTTQLHLADAMAEKALARA